MNTHTDVAIIGCGPVGVTLAGLLARRGLNVIAFDRATELYPLPRAAHLDHETMRVLQELGAADDVIDQVTINRGMDFLASDRSVLLSMRTATEAVSAWPASMMFHQPALEHAMREAAIRRGARLELGIGVAGLHDHGDRVELTLDDGTTQTAAFVVGCDGARSMVRQHLAVDVDDAGFEQRWLVVDLVLDEGAERPTTIALQVCDPRRPHTLVPMPPPRFRFEFMLLDNETDDQLNTPERITSLLADWMDPTGVTVERSAVYTFHGLVAHGWRRHRILLAGDAAHQMPPFLGQGMCSGIRDAANLAWKLARVQQHDAPMELLDTYESERSAHVRAIVDAAVFFGRMICTTDADEAAERDQSMLTTRAAKIEAGNIGETGNEIIDVDGDIDDPVPPLAPGQLVGHGGGGLSLQISLDGQRSDEVIGDRFAAITRTGAEFDEGARDSWARLGAMIIDASAAPAWQAMLDRAGGDAIVIRPDRRLLAVGDSIEMPTAAMIELLGETGETDGTDQTAINSPTMEAP
jgi:3-(3-hydroxy-phenyl)propionate hydroxylase